MAKASALYVYSTARRFSYSADGIGLPSSLPEDVGTEVAKALCEEIAMVSACAALYRRQSRCGPPMPSASVVPSLHCTALHCTAGRMCRQLAPVCGPPLHVPRSVGPRFTTRRCRNEPMAAPDRAANVNVNVASHRHDLTRGDLSQAWHNRHCNLCMVWCQSSAVSLAISVVRGYGPSLCVIHGWPAQQY